METNCKFANPGNLRRSENSCNAVHRMRSLEEMCDVVFVVDGKHFPANRAWVSATSPVLHAMLSNGMKETFQREVHIEEINSETWSRTLDFIYFETIQVSTMEDAMSLLECARRFQLEDFESILVNFLVENTDITNCCSVLMSSEYHAVDVVKSKAMDVIVSEFHSISRNDSIGLLDATLMEEVLQNNCLKIRGEVDVLAAIIRWLVLHSHSINDETHSKHGSSCKSEGDIGTDNSQNEASIEIIDKLMKHVRLDDFNLSDLQYAIHSCREAHLPSMELAFVNQFLTGVRKFEHQTPIPLEYRITHPRFSVKFSFYHRFYDVISSLANGVSSYAQYSPWTRDTLGKNRWRLAVYFGGIDYSLTGKFVSVYLCREQAASAVLDEEKIDYCLFMMGSNEQETYNFQRFRQVGLGVIGTSGCGSREFVSTQTVRDKIIESNSSITFGVTILFDATLNNGF